MKYTLEFDAVTGTAAYKPLCRQGEPSMGTPRLGWGRAGGDSGEKAGRSWRAPFF